MGLLYYLLSERIICDSIAEFTNSAGRNWPLHYSQRWLAQYFPMVKGWNYQRPITEGLDDNSAKGLNGNGPQNLITHFHLVNYA